jgi:ParB/RepB/Spo0J family partition protein
MNPPKKRFVPRHQVQGTPHPLETQPSRDDQAIILPISVIRTGNNPRSDLGDLTELCSSIKRHGVLQAVLVAKGHGSFLLIAGHRRLEAAKLAGLRTIPSRIVQADEDGGVVLALVENLQRSALNPIDEVLGVARLVPIFHGSQVELAGALGKSKAYISKCLKTAQFIKDHGVSDPKLSLSMLLELPYASDPAQAVKDVQSGQTTNSKEVRARSGPVPGGRAVSEPVYFKENPKAKTFTLRVNYSDLLGDRSKAEIITKLEEILKRLRG